MAKELALAAKNRGNAAFSKGDFQTAITEFTEAIKHDPNDNVFYSNRSGSYASIGKYPEALEDANKCISLKPDWAKGFSRKGLALLKMGKLDEAKEAYQAGLKIEPNNSALNDGLRDVEREQAAANNPMGKLFGDGMWAKLAMDPVTREYLNDQAFVQKLKMLQANPQLFGSFANDPKMSAAIGVILGIGSAGFQTMNPDGEDGTAPMGASGTKPEKKEEKPKEPEPELEPEVELSPEEAAAKKEEAAAKKEKEANAKLAEAEKLKGNAEYKKKNFEEALRFYTRAQEMDPENTVYISNEAAVYLEQKDFMKCVDTCKRAVEIETKKPRYDYKLVAKAYVRMGNAFDKAGKLVEAEEVYQKALLEDYSENAKKLLKRVEAKRKKLEEDSYLDEEKSEQAKARGNEHFTNGRWQDAIEEYSEAIKRNPKNYKVYSNRAACYSKLMAWQQALNDCEACLKLDPSFVKAYIRKGKVQHFLKQYPQALKTFDEGLKLDPNCTDLIEAKRQTMFKIQQENQSGEVDPQRAQEAMKDPEIQQILRDPMVNQVLQQMQENPASAQAALKDPIIMGKIEKLIAAGILRVG